MQNRGYAILRSICMLFVACTFAPRFETAILVFISLTKCNDIWFYSLSGETTGLKNQMDVLYPTNNMSSVILTWQREVTRVLHIWWTLWHTVYILDSRMFVNCRLQTEIEPPPNDKLPTIVTSILSLLDTCIVATAEKLLSVYCSVSRYASIFHRNMKSREFITSAWFY